MSSSIPRLRFARSLALSGVATVFALIACETAGPTAVNTPAPQSEPEVDVVESVAELELSAAQPPSPLIVVDGVIVDASLDDEGRLGKLLDPSSIESIEVVKGAAAAQLYGDRARDGAILITTDGTKRGGGSTATYTLTEKRAAEVNAVLRAKTVEGRAVTSKPVEEVVVAGRLGKVQAETVQSGKPSTLALREIAEVEAVLRSKQTDTVRAVSRASLKPRIVNGVLKRRDRSSEEITGEAVVVTPLKSGEAIATGVISEGVKIRENSAAVTAKGGVVRLRGQGIGEYTYTASRAAPIIFVDGVRVDDLDLKELDPDRIERIEVLKGAAATALYGPSAANGVIRIETKR